MRKRDFDRLYKKEYKELVLDTFSKIEKHGGYIYYGDYKKSYVYDATCRFHNENDYITTQVNVKDNIEEIRSYFNSYGFAWAVSKKELIERVRLNKLIIEKWYERSRSTDLEYFFNDKWLLMRCSPEGGYGPEIDIAIQLTEETNMDKAIQKAFDELDKKWAREKKKNGQL